MMRGDIPSISVSGNLGASAKSSPPNPHPMSAISTSFVMAFARRCSSSLKSCDSAASSLSVSCSTCPVFLAA